MPELPEVEMYKKYIQQKCLHQPIKKAEIKNIKILKDTTKNKIESTLKNTHFTQTNRIGKYVFIKLNTDPWLILHFGMTGNLKYFTDPTKEPAHSRLLITFTNNHYFSFDCQRLFGLVTITNHKNIYIKNKQIGPDALTITKNEFLNNIKNRSGKIKAILLNQHILSGIGNIYADEILFQTGIHPETPINHLSKQQKTKLYDNIIFVLNTAIKHNANIPTYPKQFLLLHRRTDNKCPLNKNHQFKTLKISGRTTYYCPIHQPKK